MTETEEELLDLSLGDMSDWPRAHINEHYDRYTGLDRDKQIRLALEDWLQLPYADRLRILAGG